MALICAINVVFFIGVEVNRGVLVLEFFCSFVGVHFVFLLHSSLDWNSWMGSFSYSIASPSLIEQYEFYCKTWIKIRGDDRKKARNTKRQKMRKPKWWTTGSTNFKVKNHRKMTPKLLALKRTQLIEKFLPKVMDQNKTRSIKVFNFDLFMYFFFICFWSK